MGCVVQIWWRPSAERPDRAGLFSLIDFHAADDFEQACLMLESGDLIAGDDLRIHRGESPAHKVIHARKPVAFRGAAVLRAELPDWKLSEDIR
jgi:hypothetical protein